MKTFAGIVLAALASVTHRISQDTHRFLREITRDHDPGRLFLGFLPAMFGADGELGSVVEAVERIRNEVDCILEGYLEEAVQILGSTFRIGVAGDTVSSLQDWVSCFGVDALVRRDDLRMTDRAILRTARDRTNGRYLLGDKVVLRISNAPNQWAPSRRNLPALDHS
jgi:hypothetical protein